MKIENHCGRDAVVSYDMSNGIFYYRGEKIPPCVSDVFEKFYGGLSKPCKYVVGTFKSPFVSLVSDSYNPNCFQMIYGRSSLKDFLFS